MKKWMIFLAAFAATTFLVGNPHTDVEVEVEVEPVPEEETVIWVGPGWYGGIWFDNEVEFNDYHHYHHDHHYYHHDHDGGGHH